MKKRYPYMTDANFCASIARQHLNEKFVKITVLDWLENPIKEIQGITTGGSLNLDGNSSMRRTCNLSAYISNTNYGRVTETDNLFAINKKIYLEIGYKNVTDKYLEYPIIWFPQGVFVMMNPSINHSVSGTTLSVQLHDKMCLLNGECGGTISSSTQFDCYDTIDENGNWITQKVLIVQIIRELVNHFGGEQLSKIIISDVDSRIKKVMKWVGTTPVYLVSENGQYKLTTSATSSTSQGVTKFETGRDVGYIYTDFIYPGDLIGNAGDTACTILDKIKSTLGNYEYFYDIDGNFIFQEKKNYLNISKSTIDLENMDKDDYLIDMSKGKAVYVFDDTNSIISLSNNPQFDKIKNDFVVWGIRENANGNTVPIRYHLAIDKKPKTGNIYECFFYKDPDDGLIKAKVPIKYKNMSELEKSAGAAGVFYMTTDNNKIYQWKDGKYVEIENAEIAEVQANDWRTELYLQGAAAEPLAIDRSYYYVELQNEWPKLYDIRKNSKQINGKTVYTGDYFQEVLDTPSDIDYFLDFIDATSEISNLSISNIGRRTHVINDNNINCVFEPHIPDFVLIETEQENTEELRNEAQAKGQNFIQVEPSIFELIWEGGNYNSAYQAIRQLLHELTSYNESISIQCLPIYTLQPNTRITVRDIESGIFGDYMISTISIPLDIGGNMSISATRALERF